jgi:hypothetical protein
LIEEEFSFLVNESKFHKICQTRQVGGYMLGFNITEKINDVYFDTDDKFLAGNKTVLRIRFVNDEKLITYKQLVNGEREEYETPHSENKFKRIRTKLKVRDKSLGAFHERVVYRTVINVSMNGVYICDIDADIVSFRIVDEYDRVDPNRENVLFYQIEVENKSDPRYHDYFIGFVNTLRRAFKLVDWKKSKTETCVIIQDLYKQDQEFRKLIEKSGRVTSNAFCCVESY